MPGAAAMNAAMPALAPGLSLFSLISFPPPSPDHSLLGVLLLCPVCCRSQPSSHSPVYPLCCCCPLGDVVRALPRSATQGVSLIAPRPDGVHKHGCVGTSSYPLLLLSDLFPHPLSGSIFTQFSSPIPRPALYLHRDQASVRGPAHSPCC